MGKNLRRGLYPGMLSAWLMPLLLTGCCSLEIRNPPQWKTLHIGAYRIDVPSNCKWKEEQGIDSYVGKIVGDDWVLQLDYGVYGGEMGQTLPEYLNNGFWRRELAYRFMREGITYDAQNTPIVKILGIRQAIAKDSVVGSGCDYVAHCRFETTEFNAPVYVPREVKQTHSTIDTLHNQYRRIVWSDDSENGITGLILRNFDTYTASKNGSYSLTLYAHKLTAAQQKTVLRILRSVRKV